MDYRKAWPAGTRLLFPGMACTLGEEIGRGSNAIVYLGEYEDHLSGQPHRVLVKELFPCAPGVYRSEGGDVCCDGEGRDAFEVHRLSFLRGNEAHLTLLKRHPERIGANLNTFPLHGTLYTLLGYSGGRSLESLLTASPALPLKQHARRLLGVLDALTAFHSTGCVHLDVSPDNVLIIGEGDREQVLLIDFNSVHDVAELRCGGAVYYSAKEGYTPPEVRTGRTAEAGPASDLYSVTAVFYRMIAGVPLTAAQLLRKAPPDVSGCPCMQDMTAPVQDMVRRILRRGLAALPRRRYQSVEDMTRDLQELIDRIEGVGVTHWALWESGRRRVAELIRANASLSYLNSRETLYPLRCVSEEASLPAEEAVARLMAGEPSALLLAPGGMGKTTTLLDAAAHHTAAYSPAVPALVYVPLYGCRADGSGHMILDRLLEGLHFRADTVTYADARKALSHLLDTPLTLREGTRPAAVLLLDGLNEASGDPALLLQELLSLACRPGVRLLVASRTDAPELPFRRLTLSPLTEEDVQEALSRHGLLLPEEGSMRELLQTPMMLSMFIQASQAEEKQLRLEDADSLLEAFLRSLVAKAQRALDEQSPARWQLEAAVQLVLPALAHALRQPDADENALLDAVTRCWKLLPARRLRRLFPGWTGRVKDIRGGAATAEEWYGLMVHTLLWQQLGLMVRDGEGRCRIHHQIMEEYLRRQYAHTVGLMEKRRFAARLTAAALAVALCVSALCIYDSHFRLVAYDTVQAETIFEHAVTRCVTGLSLNQALADQAETLYVRQAYPEYGVELFQWDVALATCDRSAADAALLPLAEGLSGTGDVMPWSREPFRTDWFAFLIEDTTARHEAYEAYGEALDLLMEDDLGAPYRDVYPQQLYQLAAIDRDILGCLYRLLCQPHMEDLRTWDETAYEEMMKLLSPYSDAISCRAERTPDSREALYTRWAQDLGVRGLLNEYRHPTPAREADYPEGRSTLEEETLLYALLSEREALENEIAATGILTLRQAIQYKGL